jgi:hypothetical protein
VRPPYCLTTDDSAKAALQLAAVLTNGAQCLLKLGRPTHRRQAIQACTLALSQAVPHLTGLPPDERARVEAKALYWRSLGWADAKTTDDDRRAAEDAAAAARLQPGDALARKHASDLAKRARESKEKLERAAKNMFQPDKQSGGCAFQTGAPAEADETVVKPPKSKAEVTAARVRKGKLILYAMCALNCLYRLHSAGLLYWLVGWQTEEEKARLSRASQRRPAPAAAGEL